MNKETEVKDTFGEESIDLIPQRLQTVMNGFWEIADITCLDHILLAHAVFL